MRTKQFSAVLAFVGTVVMSAGTAVASPGDASRARASTARYHNINVATRSGFGLFTDAAHIACIDKSGVGGMGIHYANLARVGDPAENAANPEVLVYEPGSDGQMRLVAVEYVVLQADWVNAGHESAPSLFGHSFEPVGANNRYGLPPYYELHAWIWKHNPRGMFDDWNPRVSCAAA